MPLTFNSRYKVLGSFVYARNPFTLREDENQFTNITKHYQCRIPDRIFKPTDTLTISTHSLYLSLSLSLFLMLTKKRINARAHVRRNMCDDMLPTYDRQTIICMHIRQQCPIGISKTKHKNIILPQSRQKTKHTHIRASILEKPKGKKHFLCQNIKMCFEHDPLVGSERL